MLLQLLPGGLYYVQLIVLYTAKPDDMHAVAAVYYTVPTGRTADV